MSALSDEQLEAIRALAESIAERRAEAKGTLSTSAAWKNYEAALDNAGLYAPDLLAALDAERTRADALEKELRVLQNKHNCTMEQLRIFIGGGGLSGREVVDSEPLEVKACFAGAHALCPDCGPTKVDEDGCCTACGSDCEIVRCHWAAVDRPIKPGEYELARLAAEREGVRSEVEKLARAHLKHNCAFPAGPTEEEREGCSYSCKSMCNALARLEGGK